MSFSRAATLSHARSAEKLSDLSPTTSVCDSFVPYSFIRKHKCKNCGYPLSAHPPSDSRKRSSKGTLSKKDAHKREKEEKKKKEKEEKEKLKKEKKELTKSLKRTKSNSVSVSPSRTKVFEEDVSQYGGTERKRLGTTSPRYRRDEPILKTEEDKKKEEEVLSWIAEEEKKKKEEEEKEKQKEKEKNSVGSNSTDSNEEVVTQTLRARAQTMENREMVGEYILIEKLGKGAYGVVFKALSIQHGNTVAIKKINLRGAKKEVIDGLQEEISLLKSLVHINIVRYIGHVMHGKDISIVMEYVENGSLGQMVKKYGRFPESLSKTYVRKVLSGLVYLHEQGVIHRDIKPDNILITKDGEVKLADFGVSTKLSSLKNDENVPAGTPFYMAPEVIEFLGARPQSDVWSLGCTLIELLRGEPPYFNFDALSAMYKMVEDDHPPLPSGISESLSDFLLACFTKDVNMRRSAQELLKHPWIAHNPAVEPEFSRVVNEIEGYNEELERELNKFAVENNDQEQDEIILKTKQKTLTLTKQLRQQLQAAIQTKKESPVPKHAELGFNLDGLDDNWDADFDESEQPLQLKLEFESVNEIKLDVGDENPVSPGKDSRKKSHIILEEEQPKVQLSAFQEDEMDNFDDISIQNDQPLKLQLESREEWTEWDENINFDEEPQDEKAILREKAQEALLFEVMELIGSLKPEAEPEKIKQSCLQLIEIFSNSPEIKLSLISNHGLLPLVTILNSQNDSIINPVLRVVSNLIDNKDILINLCVMGIIPIMMICGNSQHPLLTRLYAADFVQSVISNPETFQMFVACRGLSVLVDFLEPDYLKNKELVQISIDCISSIFKLKSQTTTPKNAFFHLFINEGLLERLGTTLVNLLLQNETTLIISKDSTSEVDEMTYTQKTTKMFKVFSLGDSGVKLKMCSDEVLSNLLQALKMVKPQSTEGLHLLNTIRNLSFERSTHSALTVMIEPLLDIAMRFVNSGEFVNEIFNQITHALYHICKKNKRRQEIAVKAQFIRFLIFVTENNKPLKEFTVPLMCELSGSSKMTRDVLLDCGGIPFFLDLLKDKLRTFHIDAIEAIAVCLKHDQEKTEKHLLSADLDIIKNVLVDADDNQLLNLLDSVLTILQHSATISKQMGASRDENALVAILRNKLCHPDAHVRVRLLRNLNALCTNYDQPKKFLQDHKLSEIVEFMAHGEKSIYVKKIANQLLREGSKKGKYAASSSFLGNIH